MPTVEHEKIPSGLEAPDTDPLTPYFPGYSKQEMDVVHQAKILLEIALSNSEDPEFNERFYSFLDQYPFLTEPDNRLLTTPEGAEGSGFAGRQPRTPMTTIRVFIENQEREQVNGKIAILQEPDDASLLPPKTREVHLSSHGVVNMRTVQAILKRCPNLIVIQIPPSLFDYMVGPGIKNILDQYPKVELRRKRLRDIAHYDKVPATDEYDAKKIAYQEMLNDPKKSNIFKSMLAVEMLEAQIAQRYLQGERISLRTIAHELGLPPSYVNSCAAAFFRWLGIELIDKETITRSANLEPRLARIQRVNQDKKARDQLKNNCRYGSEFPPDTLFPKHWPTWQKIMELRETNQPALLQLTKRQITTLFRYYQIGPFRGIKSDSKKIAGEWNITRQMVCLYKNQSLAKLNLLEEDEN